MLQSFGLGLDLILNMIALCLFQGTLSSIPTALTRWTDECKVLDAESMHDCVAGKLRLETKVALIWFSSQRNQVHNQANTDRFSSSCEGAYPAASGKSAR